MPMKKWRQQKIILALSGLSCLLTNLIQPTAQAAKPAAVKTSATLVKNSATKLYGRVDEVNFALKGAGITLDADKLPAFVGNVRMGSPSYYAGLADGDKILSANIIQNKLHMVFERGGKRYSLSVHTSPADLTNRRPAAEQKQTIEATISKNPEPDKIKVLSGYDVVILVDISASMMEDVEPAQKTKWEWCADYVSAFATKSQPAFKNRGITMVPFNTDYRVERQCSPEQVANLFRNTTPRGNTDFGSPLKQLLAEHLASDRKRPLIIAVLTDGIPNRGPKIEQVIIDATKSMQRDGEIQITFLEIGAEYAGTALLKYLDDYLVHDGARYDVVDAITFDELKNMNLEDALTRVIQGEKPSGKAGGLDAEIAKLKQQIDEERRNSTKSIKVN